MALFESSKLKTLRSECEELHSECIELMKQKHALEMKLYECFGQERVNQLAEKLDLSLLQKSKLALEFSIEHARLAGVPENQILHDLVEIDHHFLGES